MSGKVLSSSCVSTPKVWKGITFYIKLDELRFYYKCGPTKFC